MSQKKSTEQVLAKFLNQPKTTNNELPCSLGITFLGTFNLSMNMFLSLQPGSVITMTGHNPEKTGEVGERDKVTFDVQNIVPQQDGTTRILFSADLGLFLKAVE